MKFQDNEHEQRYINLLNKMKKHDCYHRSAAYLMALADLVPNDVFDFEKSCIKHHGVYKGWQTTSSLMATRLMFNLWNGWAYDEEVPENREPSVAYAVDNLFYNHEYAPYFYEAIRIRFEWI